MKYDYYNNRSDLHPSITGVLDLNTITNITSNTNYNHDYGYGYGNDGGDHNNNNDNAPCQGLDCYPGGVFVAVETVTVILALGGFLGNGLTVLAILTSSLRTNLNSILIGNLSLACVLYCCLVLPVQAVAYHHRRWVLPEEICVGVAAVRIWLIGVNMCLLSAIAFYRFLHVVYPQAYPQWSQSRIFFPIIMFC